MSYLLRGFVVALGLLAAACAPPAEQAQEPPAEAAAPAPQQAVLDVLTPIISAEIGKPVSLQASTANVTEEWAYIAALPRNTDGSVIDWTTTNLADRYEHGVMDESGAINALLRKQEGVWVVVEHVVAPTDVAWVDWAARHNVPAGVVDVPTAQ